MYLKLPALIGKYSRPIERLAVVLGRQVFEARSWQVGNVILQLLLNQSKQVAQKLKIRADECKDMMEDELKRAASSEHPAVGNVTLLLII